MKYCEACLAVGFLVFFGYLSLFNPDLEAQMLDYELDEPDHCFIYEDTPDSGVCVDCPYPYDDCGDGFDATERMLSLF